MSKKYIHTIYTYLNSKKALLLKKKNANHYLSLQQVIIFLLVGGSCLHVYGC